MKDHLQQYLEHHSNAKVEWKDYYLDYDVISEAIPRPIERQSFFQTIKDTITSNQTKDHENLVTGELTEFDHSKIMELRKLITSNSSKIENFYFSKIEEYQSTYRSLTNDIFQNDENATVTKLSKKSKFYSLKDLYTKLVFLKSYININSNALKGIFAQIKNSNLEVYENEFLDMKHNIYDREPFSNMLEQTEKLEAEIINVVASDFTNSDHVQAHEMLSYKTTSVSSSKDIFKVALLLGMILPLLIVAFLTYWNGPESRKLEGFWDVFPIFRGSLLLILYSWLYGVDTFVWKRFKVNYAYLMEFNPDNYLDHVNVFKLASVFTVIWLITFIMYLGTAKGSIQLLPIDAAWYPLLCILGLFTVLVLPFRVLHSSSRGAVLKVIRSLFFTPFGNCRFRENFAADILTSMAIPLNDISYSTCYYFSGYWNKSTELNRCHDYNTFLGTALAFLPYYWRLMQCLRQYHDHKQKPQLINAGKYVSALVVLFLNALHNNLERNQDWGPIRIIWLGVIICSTIYSFSWDIKMDWGLAQFRRKSNFPLRPITLYSNIWYVIAIIYNAFARCAWALTISFSFYQNKEFWQIMFGSFEIIRRASWSTIRLEWAQVSNYEKYRKTKYVPSQDEDDLFKAAETKFTASPMPIRKVIR